MTVGKRIGVFVCACGPNIADVVDIERVAGEIGKLDGVILSETFGLLCSPDGRKHLVSRIRGNDLHRVVIAACSPRDHETTFMKVCEEADLNPFMMEMVNIREHVAWVTPDRDAATEKAVRLVRGAVRRTMRHELLEKMKIVCNPDTVVIGGGLAGMTTAILLAEAGRQVTLIEKSDSPGGFLSGDRRVAEPARTVSSGKKGIKMLLNTQPEEIVGFFGNFVLSAGNMEIKAGAVVLATGCIATENGGFAPAEDFGRLAELLRLPLDDEGFPEREHASLSPLATPIEGVYVTGCAGGPCFPEEAVARSEAVAGAILSSLVPGRELETEPRTSVISETLCRGCKTCLEVCTYGAISFDAEKLVCGVNGVLCRGCGNCAAACPSGAIRSRHFTPDQLRYQVEGLLR